MTPKLPKNFKQWERFIEDAKEGKPTTITRKIVIGLRKALNNYGVNYDARVALHEAITEAVEKYPEMFPMDADSHARALVWMNSGYKRWRSAVNSEKYQGDPDSYFVDQVEETINGNINRITFGGMQLIENHGYAKQWMKSRPIWRVVPHTGEPWRYAYSSWQASLPIDYNPEPFL